jgi:hypothetical protein
MHLVLGHPDDPCCTALLEKLEVAGCEARLIAAPLEAPARHNLRIDSNGTSSTALILGERPAERIESVFVRSSGAVDKAGWEPADHTYMQAEVHAAMLGWLFALDCPVVNRVNAELWYRARLPLLHWLGRLRACGLLIPDVIITNDEADVDRFRRDAERCEVRGAVFLSLAQLNSWLVGRDEWNGVMALSAHGPVCLAEPHGPVRLLCIVGQDIIWDREPASDEAALSARLLRFAHLAGLEFVEIGLARVHAGIAVVHVELLPRLERFPQDAQSRILDGLMDLLLGTAVHRLAEACS